MSETVLVAIVAVLGTTFGAAVSPTINLLRDFVQSKSGAKSERLKAAATFAEALVKLAQVTPEDFQSIYVRKTYTTAVEARFDLAQHLPRGSGQVDAFAEHAIMQISAYRNEEPRLVAAEYAASQVLAWARDDKKPRELKKFWLTSHRENEDTVWEIV